MPLKTFYDSPLPSPSPLAPRFSLSLSLSARRNCSNQKFSWGEYCVRLRSAKWTWFFLRSSHLALPSRGNGKSKSNQISNYEEHYSWSYSLPTHMDFPAISPPETCITNSARWSLASTVGWSSRGETFRENSFVKYCDLYFDKCDFIIHAAFTPKNVSWCMRASEGKWRESF